jgi:uncharacterized protein YjbI with pentapeptide repeats
LFFALIGSEISRVVIHLDHQELGVTYDQSPAVPPSALQSSQMLAGVAPLACPFFPSPGSVDLGSVHLGFADLGFADLGSADLGSADLGSADLGSADLGSADLGSADLSVSELVFY